jgi:hypothetical protein
MLAELPAAAVSVAPTSGQAWRTPADAVCCRSLSLPVHPAILSGLSGAGLPQISSGNDCPSSRSRLRIAAIAALALYVAAWLGLGSYEVARVTDDGISLLAVTTTVAVGLTSLVIVGSRLASFGGMPVGGGITWLGVGGCVLIVPLAIPVGLLSAWFLVHGVLGQPHSVLRATDLSPGWQEVLAYGVLVALPFLVGSAFLVVGRRPRAFRA